MAARSKGGWIREDADGITLRVHAQPGASSCAVGPVDPWRDALRVSVTARAEGGRANDELCVAVAQALDVPRSAVSIKRGAQSRAKTLRVAGVRAAAARRVFGGPL